MIETLYNAAGLDETRIRRAFRWVITFRDFPIGSYQTVDGNSMMSEALTLFTKGRAEFYLDGVRRADRVPGILSTEHDEVGLGGEFRLIYTEPTTRLCIPRNINKTLLPLVRQIKLELDEVTVTKGSNFLVCLGSVQVQDRIFKEEQSFSCSTDMSIKALERSILLEFL